jgi:hypothetical protein
MSGAPSYVMQPLLRAAAAAANVAAKLRRAIVWFDGACTCGRQYRIKVQGWQAWRGGSHNGGDIPSHSSFPGSFRCECMSITPGETTRFPKSSTTSLELIAGRPMATAPILPSTTVTANRHAAVSETARTPLAAAYAERCESGQRGMAQPTRPCCSDLLCPALPCAWCTCGLLDA